MDARRKPNIVRGIQGRALILVGRALYSIGKRIASLAGRLETGCQTGRQPVWIRLARVSLLMVLAVIAMRWWLRCDTMDAVRRSAAFLLGALCYELTDYLCEQQTGWTRVANRAVQLFAALALLAYLFLAVADGSWRYYLLLVAVASVLAWILVLAFAWFLKRRT